MQYYSLPQRQRHLYKPSYRQLEIKLDNTPDTQDNQVLNLPISQERLIGEGEEIRIPNKSKKVDPSILRDRQTTNVKFSNLLQQNKKSFSRPIPLKRSTDPNYINMYNPEPHVSQMFQNRLTQGQQLPNISMRNLGISDLNANNKTFIDRLNARNAIKLDNEELKTNIQPTLSSVFWKDDNNNQDRTILSPVTHVTPVVTPKNQSIGPLPLKDEELRISNINEILHPYPIGPVTKQEQTNLAIMGKLTCDKINKNLIASGLSPINDPRANELTSEQQKVLQNVKSKCVISGGNIKIKSKKKL